MIKVAPSILSSDFSNLGGEVTRLDRSSADYIHVDVMDGHFVPNITIGPGIVKSLRPFSKKVFDVHLMLTEPGKYLTQFVEAGADIVGVHHEMAENRIALLQRIRALGAKACIVYNPDSDLKDVTQYFDHVDQILIMSVFPGFGGQKFIPESLERGRFVAQKLREHGNPPIDLEIDGGVALDNCRELVEAGFNVLVSGSGLYRQKNLETAIDEMKKRGNGV